MQSYIKKIVTPEQLVERIGLFPREKKVGMACGCFDLCHPGHLRHFAYIKNKADILVVMVTADRFINKGAYRPAIPEQIRAESLAALELVDYVVIDQNSSNLVNIGIIKPDYFCKGYEYSDYSNPCTPFETKLVEGYSGEMLFSPGDIVFSSTKLLDAHLPKLRIEKLIDLMKRFDIAFDSLRGVFKKFSDYRIHIIGDSIIDTYTRTSLIGSNAKTPTFSVLYQGHEDFIGGAGIVALHLEAAGAKVHFTTHRETIKNTIICGDHRLLKIDNVDNTPIPPRDIEKIALTIRDTPADCVVFSDFRHGIFHKGSIPIFTSVIPKGVFTVADSQVASRWGNITEFKGFDLITPNEKEARFALADQDSNIGRLISATKEAAKAKNILMKLGERGMMFLQDDLPYSIDSFADDVKDAVGAGDAFLAYATLTMLATKSLPMACILGSIAAACECEIDGNKPISPELVLQKLERVEKMI